MTEPLTDEQLANLRALDFLNGAISDFDRTCAAVAATRTLVREVDRLRAELAVARAQVAAVEEHARRKADRGIVVDPNILLMLLDDHAVPAAGEANR